MSFVTSSGPGAAWVRQQQEAAQRMQGAALGPTAGGGSGGALPAQVPDRQSMPAGGDGRLCSACREPIVNDHLTVGEQTYHRSHFICWCCSQPLSVNRFFIHDDKPYCELDHNHIFTVRCSSCGDLIVDQFVRVDDQYFHLDHFCCKRCGKRLASQRYLPSKGGYVCISCWQVVSTQETTTTPERCEVCGSQSASEPMVQLKSGEYVHQYHMSCKECGVTLNSTTASIGSGSIYCRAHLKSSRQQLCAQCGEEVTGRSVFALGSAYHPEHFVCTTCGETLHISKFFEREGLPYCYLHYSMQENMLCNTCNQPVGVHSIYFLTKYYHPEHFVCTTCNSVIQAGTRTREWDGKPYCQKCYKKMPKQLRSRYKKNKITMQKIQRREEQTRRDDKSSKS